MTRRTIAAALVAALLLPFLAIHAEATGPAPDAYYVSNIQSTGASWSPMGSYNPAQSTNSGCLGYTPNNANCMYSGGSYTNGTTTEISQTTSTGPAQSGWPCCIRGTPSTGDPGPFSHGDALQLNGGWSYTTNFNTFTTDWEWCGYFDGHDQNGAVLMSTKPFNTDGTLKAGALYVAIGTIDNLVVGVYQSGSNPVVGVANNDFLNYKDTWLWMCVSYTNANHTVLAHWPHGGTASFVSNGVAPLSWGPDSTAPTGAGCCNAYSEGNIGLYGFGFWSSATGGDHTYLEPTCAQTNSCGNAGAGGTGNGNCPQVGLLSGAPKFQWCYPQLGCQNFDTGWNIGQDILWLGCSIEQVGLAVIGTIINALIDLVVPDWVAIQNAWQAAYDTFATHVPVNYAVGALSYLPTVLAGAHTTPSVSFPLPPPWSFTVNLTWSQIFGLMAPYRGIVLGFLYLGFAVAVTMSGRRAFEH